MAIACIEYGWTCKLKYERVRVPEELLYIGKTSCRACKITCSKSWRGALEDGGVEDQSGHLPVRHGPPTDPW